MKTREEILTTIKKHLQIANEDWKDDQFDPELSMAEMGIDSLDSISIIFGIMKELNIKIIRESYSKMKTINEIVNDFVQEKNNPK